MTTSAFAWLDYSDGERRRMLEVIDLFREKGTVDEIGIGSIRDTFADRFFPAISTIQSRARYFLFIPWIYQMLERERIPSARAGPHARYLQAQLVDGLKAGGEGTAAGLIGIDAGADARPASSTGVGCAVSASSPMQAQRIDITRPSTASIVARNEPSDLRATSSSTAVITTGTQAFHPRPTTS